MVEDFRQLRVWQHAMALVKRIYRLTAMFPKDELYGLTSQMRRAAVSVPSNIAEGNGRRSRGEYIQNMRPVAASSATTWFGASTVYMTPSTTSGVASNFSVGSAGPRV